MQVHTCIGRIGVGGGDISAGKSCRPSYSVIAVLGHGFNLIKQPLFFWCISTYIHTKSRGRNTHAGAFAHVNSVSVHALTCKSLQSSRLYCPISLGPDVYIVRMGYQFLFMNTTVLELYGNISRGLVARRMG